METSNGFGSVGRAFASNINGSQFKARYWQKELIYKFTVNCWKKKRSWILKGDKIMKWFDAIKADNNISQSERSKPTQYNFVYKIGPKARFLKPTSRQCITRILPQSVKQKMENIFLLLPL